MRLIGFTTTVVVILTMTAQAAPPVVNYQGVLRSSAGSPQTGNYQMVFRFFDDAVGGDEILVDTHTAVTVSGGLFSVGLGGGVLMDGTGPGTYGSLEQVLRDHAQVHLQVEVESEVLLPRTPIRSAAYTLAPDPAQIHVVWGRDLCPGDSLIHQGDAVQTTSGSAGGSQAVCMDRAFSGTWLNAVPGVAVTRAERNPSTSYWYRLDTLTETAFPCAVCSGSAFTLWATKTCPAGRTLLYTGQLVTLGSGGNLSQPVCADIAGHPWVNDGTSPLGLKRLDGDITDVVDCVVCY